MLSDDSLLSGRFDYAFLNEVPNALDCSICHLILRDPVQVRDCGHRFCKTCLNEHQRRNGPWCPNDRKPLGENQLFDDMACKRDVLSLLVKCPNKQCTWNGELSNVQEHQQLKCQFEHVQCPNIPCTVSMVRVDVLEHATNECEWRSVRCRLCGKSSPACKRDPLCIEHEEYFLDHLSKLENQYSELKDKYDQLCSKVGDCKVTKKVVKSLSRKFEELDEKVKSTQSTLDDLCATTQDLSEKNSSPPRRNAANTEWLSSTKIMYTTIVVAVCGFVLASVAVMKGHESEIADLNKRLSQLRANMHSDSEMIFAEITKQIKDQTEDAVGFVKRELKEQMNSYSKAGYVIIRIDDVHDAIKKGKDSGGDYFIDTTPIYTHASGFKVKMRVFPGGTGSGIGNYLSVGIVIMRGDYDYQPNMWPFRRTVRFTMIDQNDIATRRKDISVELVPGAVGSERSFMRPVESENKHRTIELFYSLYNLRQGSYIRDDSLLLRMDVL